MVIDRRTQLWLTARFYVTVGSASRVMCLSHSLLSLRRRCLSPLFTQSNGIESRLVRASILQTLTNDSQNARPQQVRCLDSFGRADVHQLPVLLGSEAGHNGARAGLRKCGQLSS